MGVIFALIYGCASFVTQLADPLLSKKIPQNPTEVGMPWLLCLMRLPVDGASRAGFAMWKRRGFHIWDFLMSLQLNCAKTGRKPEAYGIFLVI